MGFVLGSSDGSGEEFPYNGDLSMEEEEVAAKTTASALSEFYLTLVADQVPIEYAFLLTRDYLKMRFSEIVPLDFDDDMQ